MNRYYPYLGSPLKIGGLTLKNRMLAAPVSNPELGPDMNMTKDNIAFYGLRAKGGAACVTISEGTVHMPTGKTHVKNIQLDNPLSLPSLTEAAMEIHRHSCYASIELAHGGRLSGQWTNDIKRYGPVDEIWEDGTVVFQMPEKLILEIADSFGKAAAMVKKAGFDMVLVHAGHGWLLNQFMSPNTNRRTDEWGGSFEKRMRFPLLCIQKIREAVGPAFPIEFRMSGAEYAEGGYDIGYGVQIAEAIDGKVDLIHVSAGAGSVRASVITHPSMFIEHGCNVHLAAEIKKHVKTPVATLGGLSDPDMMEEIIASGKADVVEMARQLLADPFFPEKALTGRKEDITRCCRCFSCFTSERTQICALNPVIGREREHKNAFAPTTPKKVLVAGGGPGGMAAALKAAERGHQVILFEKGNRLGGKLLFEEFIPFKADLYSYALLQEKRVMAQPRIQVRLGTELNEELARKENADVIMCAVGAEPVIPPLPGLKESGRTVGLEALHHPIPALGDKVVILGGGLVGSESAVYLHSLGKDVTIVEMREGLAMDAPALHRQAIEFYLQDNHIKVYLGTKARAVTDEGLLCENEAEGEFWLPADSVFLAAGMRPDTKAVEELRYAAPRFFQIGDCFKVGKVHDAICAGYYGAVDI